MKITSSYGVEIRKAGGALSSTLKTYREAVRVLSLFYDSVWEEVSSVEGEEPCPRGKDTCDARILPREHVQGRGR